MQQMYRMFYVDLKSNLEALENGNFCNIFLVEHICIRYLYIFPILLRKKSRRKTLVCQSSCLWEYWLYDKLLFNVIKTETRLKVNRNEATRTIVSNLKVFLHQIFHWRFLFNHYHADWIDYHKLFNSQTTYELISPTKDYFYYSIEHIESLHWSYRNIGKLLHISYWLSIKLKVQSRIYFRNFAQVCKWDHCWMNMSCERTFIFTQSLSVLSHISAFNECISAKLIHKPCNKC